MDKLIATYFSDLKKHRLRNTKPRKAVFNALHASDHIPLTMKELINRTADQADRASIYRAVEVLESAGIIKRIHIGWKYKLELSDQFHGHHHHITCVICGNVHATHNDQKLEQELHKLAEQCGYQIVDHNLDIKGVCSRCKLTR